MKTKILLIKEIVTDKECYPRTNSNWMVAYNYASAMKTGARFPPIAVCFLKGVCYLVDGQHRMEASKKLKRKSITCEILKLKSKKEIFLEAVKRNVLHGAGLNLSDRISVIRKLQNMKFTDIKISKLVHMPIKDIQKFVVERITNDVTGEEIVLKTPYIGLSGKIVSSDFGNIQSHTSGRNAEDSVDNLIALIDTKAITLKNKRLINKLKILYKMIGKLVLKGRKRF